MMPTRRPERGRSGNSTLTCISDALKYKLLGRAIFVVVLPHVQDGDVVLRRKVMPREAGSDIVRVGTGIFGQRHAKGE